MSFKNKHYLAKIFIFLLLLSNTAFAANNKSQTVYEKNKVYLDKYLESKQKLIRLTKDKKTKAALITELKHYRYLIQQAKIPLMYEGMKLDRKHPGDGICIQDVNNFKDCQKIEHSYTRNGCTIKSCIEKFLSITDETDKYLIRMFPKSNANNRIALIGHIYVSSLSIFADAERLVAEANKRHNEGRLSDFWNNVRLARVEMVKFKKALNSIYNDKTGFDKMTYDQKAELIKTWHSSYPYHKNQAQFKRKPTKERGGGGWYNRSELSLKDFFSND